MRRVFMIAGLMLIIGGIVGLLYPTVIQTQYDGETKQLIGEYRDMFRRFDDENLIPPDSSYVNYFDQFGTNTELLYQLMKEYNEALFLNKQQELTDPFSYERVDFSLKPFGFPEEINAFISIPKLNVEMPVYLGASMENLDKGAAHMSQTSLPIGGDNTNAAIAAHRGSHLAMLRDIQKLSKGDRITVTNFREVLTYEVVYAEIIHPTQIDKILIQEGRDMVTLITCHPYSSTRQRYVVYCERV